LAGFAHRDRQVPECISETSHPIVFPQSDGVSESLLSQAQAEMRSPVRSVTRQDLTRKYLRGSGIEIGALQHPLSLPPGVEIKYVDRLTVDGARQEFPELGDMPLVTPSIITDANTLAGIADESYDFCVACNVIEHLRDPIGALEHWLRILKPGGVLFLECPDQSNFMDRLRPVTSLDHLIADHEHREARAEFDRQHYFESVNSTHHQLPELERNEIAEKYFATSYAVHFHTFDETSFRRLLQYMTTRVRFTVPEAHVLKLPEIVEFVAILQKAT
jgi:SAM-dependent methyltransferase